MKKILLFIPLGLVALISINSLALAQELSRWNESSVSQTDYQVLLDNHLREYAKQAKVTPSVSSTYKDTLNKDIVDIDKAKIEGPGEYLPVGVVHPIADNRPMAIYSAPEIGPSHEKQDGNKFLREAQNSNVLATPLIFHGPSNGAGAQGGTPQEMHKTSPEA